MNSNSDYRKRLGNYGEDLALRLYLTQHYQLRERQYRCSFGEIDLILEKDGTIFFVEVRTKTSTSFGYAEESIGWRKKRTIQRVAQFYLKEHHLHSRHIQFDVVAIHINKIEKKASVLRFPQSF